MAWKSGISLTIQLCIWLTLCRPSTSIHWNFNFRRFFLTVYSRLLLTLERLLEGPLHGVVAVPLALLLQLLDEGDSVLVQVLLACQGSLAPRHQNKTGFIIYSTYFSFLRHKVLLKHRNNFFRIKKKMNYFLLLRKKVYSVYLSAKSFTWFYV